MKKSVKAFLCVVLALLLVLPFAGCAAKKEPAPEQNPQAEGGEQGKEPDPLPVVTNPLTGLAMSENLVGKRPYAVMINNVKQALPQKGISKADLFVEFPTEGSTNRIMAVFSDVSGIPEIGTVRSSRDYFVDYAESLDAIYLHYGASPQAYTIMKERKIDHLDGINGAIDASLYWRDQARAKKNGSEHSVFTSGEKILATVEKNSIRTESKKSGDFFSFGTPLMDAGKTALSVTVPFSNYITPKFTYDAEKGVYLREQYGKPHVDAGENDVQLAVKNVFVLFTKVTSISGDSSGRLAIDTLGEGEGFYLTGGKAVAIRWSKKDNESFPTFTDESGRPLTVSEGTSWICVLSKGSRDKVVME